MTTHLLFVYGTLKRGYGNYHRILADAEFVGEAVTISSDYIMQNVGFPILWNERSATGSKAAGEIFEITSAQLKRCDRLEGHPDMYRREKRIFLLKVTEEDTQPVEAWVYLWQGRHDGDEIIPGSDGAYRWEGRQSR
jgi:gamma-glutamylaminecyclotransferase